ncbi:hypothetical protein [Embleya hyalina]|uniref:Uncharacterized protein n=1 Tax=Embleya hyalina TaxID=516124 RepID=A0A401Z686_9ACTN|nr:hypothetical protein [Embleya hyalina]GCE02357.1 hypothetical protein EHYA_10134 [Embleya hyalina]
MTSSVLVLGVDPHIVPGTNGAAILATLEAELARFAEYGIHASMTVFGPDETAGPKVVAALTERAWDVVLIGGGVRKSEQLLSLFEQIVNLIRIHAPGAAIAFNTTVDTIVEAARRHL